MNESRLPTSNQRLAEVLHSVFTLLELVISELPQPASEEALGCRDVLVQYQASVRDSILPTLEWAIKKGSFR